MFYIYRIVKIGMSYVREINTVVIILRESNWMQYAFTHYIAIPWMVAFVIIEVIDPFSSLALSINLSINIALLLLLMPKTMKRATRKIKQKLSL